jgi:ribosomal protein L35
MKIKTHQVAAKRFHLTKKKKILKRYCGQDHFNARDSGKISRKKRRDTQISKSYRKTLRKLIPYK